MNEGDSKMSIFRTSDDTIIAKAIISNPDSIERSLLSFDVLFSRLERLKAIFAGSCPLTDIEAEDEWEYWSLVLSRSAQVVRNLVMSFVGGLSSSRT
jgi:hypothetical protein